MIKIIGNYRVELFRKSDNSWNYRVYDIRTARTSPYIVPNATYETQRQALESAKDYISRQ